MGHGSHSYPQDAAGELWMYLCFAHLIYLKEKDQIRLAANVSLSCLGTLGARITMGFGPGRMLALIWDRTQDKERKQGKQGLRPRSPTGTPQCLTSAAVTKYHKMIQEQGSHLSFQHLGG